MFERIIQTSEALGTTTEGDAETLIPALCGCEACGTKQLIAAPLIGICAECGAERSVLTSGIAARLHGDELETWSPYAA
jgi:Zn finger protein HypA/HybF involved in hydrogenase expression